jgi:hypothetical protein
MQNGRNLVLAAALALITAFAAGGFALAGGDAGGSSLEPVLDSEIFSVGKVKVHIKWDNMNRCEGTVYYWTPSMKENEWRAAREVIIDINVTEKGGEKPANAIEWGAFEGNRGCGVGYLITRSSPTYIYIKIGNKTYKVCCCDCPNTPTCE